MTDKQINRTYGSLKEAVHSAGYSFERALSHLKWMLQGNRWQLEGEFADYQSFIGSLKFDNFKILAAQRKEIAKLIKAAQPDVSNRAIAHVLNVSHETINNDIGNNLPDGSKKAKQNKRAQIDIGNNLPPLDGIGPTEIVRAAEKRAMAPARREERLAKIEAISKGNATLVASRKYPIILADPPWRYENPPIGDSNRSIENHYPTMTLADICALPVAEIAADDALLYLWATSPKLAECFHVVRAWGFEYRTNLVWVKDKIGTGYHARSQHELVLVCRRGEMPPPIAGTQSSSVIFSERGEHSEKPTAFHELIERLYPDIGKIELFQRRPRIGWDAWGNQAEAAA